MYEEKERVIAESHDNRRVMVTSTVASFHAIHVRYCNVPPARLPLSVTQYRTVAGQVGQRFYILFSLLLVKILSYSSDAGSVTQSVGFGRIGSTKTRNSVVLTVSALVAHHFSFAAQYGSVYRSPLHLIGQSCVFDERALFLPTTPSSRLQSTITAVIVTLGLQGK